MQKATANTRDQAVAPETDDENSGSSDWPGEESSEDLSSDCPHTEPQRKVLGRKKQAPPAAQVPLDSGLPKLLLVGTKSALLMESQWKANFDVTMAAKDSASWVKLAADMQKHLTSLSGTKAGIPEWHFDRIVCVMGSGEIPKTSA